MDEAQDDGFGDSTCEVLQDLYASNIDVSISWVSGGGIDVKLGDQVRGIVAEKIFPGIVDDALNWLQEKACEAYPDSLIADKYRPPYVSPYVPGSPRARAAGCICCPRTPEEWHPHAIAHCPEHGFATKRVIKGRLVEVDRYWRPDRRRLR